MYDYSKHLTQMFAQYKNNNIPICINFREIVKIQNFDRLTHYIHAYPAKLLQCIPIYFINNSMLTQKNDIIYDPFCGSGTVSIEALHAEMSAINRDINPFATLITNIKCTYLDENYILNCLEEVCSRLNKFKFKDFDVTNKYFWYSKYVYNILSKILQSICCIDDDSLSSFFKVCFSSVARKMSYADPRISVPVRLKPNKYPEGHRLRIAAEKKILDLTPKNTLEVFKAHIRANAKRVSSIPHFDTKKMRTTICRAQELPSLDEQGKASLIITSPPYPGAQKYIRASSLSLHWLGLHSGCLTPLKKQVIGREEVVKSDYTGSSGCTNADIQLCQIAHKNVERAAVAEAYLREMRDVFKSCWAFLKNDGYLVIVVANNLFCGIEFYTQTYLCEIAQNEGFSLELELVDDIKSYGLMTKRNKTAGVISREIVTVFRKSK